MEGAIKIPEIPKITNPHSTSPNSDVCPVCKGSGWESYIVSARELEYVYGDNAVDTEYVRRCRRCLGINPNEGDTTGVPDYCHEADIYKFSFDCYGQDMSNYRDITFSFFEDFREWQSNGRGLYIYSTTPGSGKTFLACCVCKSIMMKYNVRFKFITVPDYIDKVSEGYTLAKQGIPNSPADIYKDVDLLVLDDMGAQLAKDWQNAEMFKLINTRISKNLVTVYTSNYSISELKIEDRTKSRIAATTIPFHLPEVSIRNRKANSAQEDFLKKVLKK